MITRSDGRHRRSGRRHLQVAWGRRIAVVAVVLGCAAALSGGWAVSRSDDEPAVPSAATPTEPGPAGELRRPGSTDWSSILGGLSRRRSAAWQHSRPGDLTGVFMAGSAALERDQAVLREYLRRGLTVDRARVEFGAVHDVVRRTPGVVRLEVTDRLSTVRVRTRGGDVRTLPRDRPTRHVLWLRRTDHGWRISAIDLATR